MVLKCFYYLFQIRRVVNFFSESCQFMTVQHVLQMEVLFNPGNTCGSSGYAFLIAYLRLVQW